MYAGSIGQDNAVRIRGLERKEAEVQARGGMLRSAVDEFLVKVRAA